MTTGKTVEDIKASYYAGLEDVQLTLDEIQHALRRAAVNKKALQKYVELVKEIPEVSEVRYDRDYDIVAVIYSESDFLGEAGRSLAKALGEVYRHVSPVVLDFQHVNHYDYTPERIDRMEGETVWKR